jgi:hypothetical protein
MPLAPVPWPPVPVAPVPWVPLLLGPPVLLALFPKMLPPGEALQPTVTAMSEASVTHRMTAS